MSEDAEGARGWVATRHARMRMRRRGVPEEAITRVLAHYHTRRPAPPSDAPVPADILIGDFEGRTLKVYVERGSDPPKVRTVVWDG